MNPSPNPIEQSFELAASRCTDLTPLVYQRLFEQHPETRAMFRTQGSELVMGSMLALTIEAILDLCSRCTDLQHDGFEVFAITGIRHALAVTGNTVLLH